MSCGLMWFREDLRVSDNTAITIACEENEAVVAVYIIDHSMLVAHDVAACRVEFILRNLEALHTALMEKNIRLLIFETKNTAQLPIIFEKIIHFYSVDTLYFNEQYEINEARRDSTIKKSLSIPVKSFLDQCIFEPKKLLTQSGTPYTIFTPYKRNFLQRVAESPHLIPYKTISACAKLLPSFEASSHLQKYNVNFHAVVPSKIADYSSDIPVNYWPGGEITAHKRLKKFIQLNIENYHEERDFPEKGSTSKLSAYLANGVLSPRQCFSAAIKANHGRLNSGSPGIICWINELIWREFYKQMLENFPRVSMCHAFKEDTENWPWRHDEKLFHAWKNAETGYPLIDAAMRQLHQTGWMHNRLRMVVAMFLTKDCFIDWRWGEKYFMQHLIDGDLAANNGGWQWAASTGCDAVPYFRAFNPVRQSERFDAEGDFIKKYCPELSHVPKKQIHDPFKLPAGLNYPKPIVDHRETRNFLRNTLGK